MWNQSDGKGSVTMAFTAVYLTLEERRKGEGGRGRGKRNGVPDPIEFNAVLAYQYDSVAFEGTS